MFGYLALAALAGLCAGVGDTFLSYWAKTGRPEWFAGGLIVLNAALVIFAHLLRKGTLAQSVVLFIVGNVVVVALVSHFILHEPISPVRWACLSIAVVAVVAMELL